MGQDHTIPGFALQDFRTGNESAFKVLFDYYYQALCSFSFRITNNGPASEEIAGDSLLKLWQRRSDFDNELSVKAFLYLATRNASLNSLKSTSRRNQLLADAAIIPGVAEEHDILRQIIQTEILSRIHAAIRSLPPKYSQVLTLSFEQGLKGKEIAAMLGIPQSTVDNRKARGLALLRKVLDNRAFLVLISLL